MQFSFIALNLGMCGWLLVVLLIGTVYLNESTVYQNGHQAFPLFSGGGGGGLITFFVPALSPRRYPGYTFFFPLFLGLLVVQSESFF